MFRRISQRSCSSSHSSTDKRRRTTWPRFERGSVVAGMSLHPQVPQLLRGFPYKCQFGQSLAQELGDQFTELFWRLCLVQWESSSTANWSIILCHGYTLFTKSR
eukprot:5340690-Amphidinium_carterae.1